MLPRNDANVLECMGLLANADTAIAETMKSLVEAYYGSCGGAIYVYLVTTYDHLSTHDPQRLKDYMAELRRQLHLNTKKGGE